MLNIKTLQTASGKAGQSDGLARPALRSLPGGRSAARSGHTSDAALAGQATAPVESVSTMTTNPDFDAGSEWNPATFERVVTQYQSRIYRFIFAMVGEVELAHDLTQDTFLLAYRNLCRRAASAGLDNPADAAAFARWQQSQPLSNMSAWLYTIARNTVLSEMRRRKIVRFLPFHHRPADGSDEEFDTMAENALLEAGGSLEARVALHDELQQAMDRVGREKLTALLLHMDGFSYKEICDITGDSLSSIKSQIFRAKESLRKALAGSALLLAQDLGEGPR